jgi:hypothetical protein
MTDSPTAIPGAAEPRRRAGEHLRQDPGWGGRGPDVEWCDREREGRGERADEAFAVSVGVSDGRVRPSGVFLHRLASSLGCDLCTAVPSHLRS